MTIDFEHHVHSWRHAFSVYARSSPSCSIWQKQKLAVFGPAGQRFIRDIMTQRLSSHCQTVWPLLQTGFRCRCHDVIFLWEPPGGGNGWQSWGGSGDGVELNSNQLFLLQLLLNHGRPYWQLRIYSCLWREYFCLYRFTYTTHTTQMLVTSLPLSRKAYFSVTLYEAICRI